MDFQKTIGWNVETTDWIGLTAKSTNYKLSQNLFQKH